MRQLELFSVNSISANSIALICGVFSLWIQRTKFFILSQCAPQLVLLVSLCIFQSHAWACFQAAFVIPHIYVSTYHFSSSKHSECSSSTVLWLWWLCFKPSVFSLLCEDIAAMQVTLLSLLLSFCQSFWLVFLHLRTSMTVTLVILPGFSPLFPLVRAASSILCWFRRLCIQDFCWLHNRFLFVYLKSQLPPRLWSPLMLLAVAWGVISDHLSLQTFTN